MAPRDDRIPEDLPGEVPGRAATAGPSSSDRTFSYDDILEKESDHLLRYMLVGDIDPWMFHQTNLRAYDGTHTLLTDVVDRTLDKHEALFDLPVSTLAMGELGTELQMRTERHDSGVTGTIVPGRSITLTVARDATIAVTGLETSDASSYGGQAIAHVRVTAGTPITLPLP